MVPKTVRLAVYFHDELRAVRELAVPFVIGRSHDADLTISHPMVSRRHCRVFEENGTFRLQDLGSLNGTCLGQERVADLELRAGTEFLIGTIRFVFHPADAMESPAFATVSDSDFVKAEVFLESPDDLPPPLPASIPSPVGISSSSMQGTPGLPSFIKPLPQFPPIQDEEEDGVTDVPDVIDLADIADKEALTPPSLPIRERK